MKIKPAIIALLCVFAMCACGSGADKLEKENIEIARSYRSLYRSSEKDGTISLSLDGEAVAAIVASLAGDGHAVTDSSGENGISGSGQVVDFCAGRTEALALFIVCPDGGFLRYDLRRNAESTVSRLSWNGSTPVHTYSESFAPDDCALTDGGYFTFSAPGGRVFLRVEPRDEALYSLCEQYILPIGYGGTNLFTADWSSREFDALDLNALFGAFWSLDNALGPEYSFENDGITAFVPAETFESILSRRLGADAGEIRALARFDAEKGAYPVHITTESDSLLLGSLPSPEVRRADENADGSITLEVHAVSAIDGRDSVFVHEVTVEPLPDGGWQYISNRIIHTNDESIPEHIDMLELTGAA